MTQLLQPPSCLLAGPSGSGKTSALATQLLYGLEVFVLVTEPDGVASLLDAAERLKAPIDKLHWAYCPPAAAGWDGLEDMIKRVNSMDQKGLSDIRDMGKSDFRPAAMNFLNLLRNFYCDRTKTYYGDVTTWDDSRSFNIDSLTGWSLIGWGCTVGYKPTANPGEWGIAQNFIYNMLTKILPDRSCFFNLTAHVEREVDEMTGARKVMVSTIGAKLAPKIPPFFSEFIRTSREMDSQQKAVFRWSTLAADMDLKNRALPVGTQLKADFGPVVDAYRRRVSLAGSAGGVSSPPPQDVGSKATSTPHVVPITATQKVS